MSRADSAHGRPVKTKGEPGGKHSLKYFGETFMIPWAEKVLENNANLDDIVLPILRAEIVRMKEGA